ncbi:EAL domain-containing protein [Candidatus Methylospira mobilis]|uniref:EAL domain-containing protein n=1 Tax=Candidatus Methylospira mobilis TaxID=1808979 RepID=UPI0028EBC458|nr:EAL domain-containing protein [Candidatus Methylospira mobilis]WNV05749.1 EAL domain-containing protein [Candidatus Methylospira mobilis]
MNKKLTPFVLAILLPLLALAAQSLLWTHIQPLVLFLFYPAVFFAAELAGLYAGLAATALSVLLVNFFFTPSLVALPTGNRSSQYTIAGFIAMGILFSLCKGINNRKTTAQFQILFGNMLNGYAHCRMIYISGFATDFEYLNVNPAFERLTGLRNVIGKKVSTLIPGIRRDNPELIEIYGRVARTGEAAQFETYLAALDIWFSVSVYRPRPDEFVAVFENITARKKAEQAVVHSEKEFRLLAEAMPQIVWITRPDGWVIYINHQWVDYTGLSLDESYGHNWTKPFHPDDRQHAWDAWQHAVNNIASYNNECRLRGADGIFRWWLIRGVPVFDENRQICKWFGTCTDIDEYKKFEAALLKSRQNMQTFIKQAPLSIAMFDQHMNYLAVSDRWLMEFGQGHETLIGHNYYELHPESASKWRVIHQQGLTGATLKSDDDFWIREDGSKYWLRWSVSPWTDEHGNTGGIIISTENITEHKLAEQQLRIAATAFESMEGMIITDADANIIRVNQAFSGITGYTSDEVIGKNPRILQSGRQDAGFYNMIWDSVSNTGSWQGEIWNRRKNGEIYPEHLSITAVKDADGAITNYVGTIFDITRSKTAEEQITRLGFYDFLTGLPNRRLLLDRLSLAFAYSARYETIGALLFIDLDNFKLLNDSLGHDLGDLLLQQIAAQLAACVRDGDTVARHGGDEFVLILNDLGKQALEAEQLAKAIAEKILVRINRRYQLDKHEYNNSCSIGVAFFGDSEFSADELLKQADIAMYQAKKAGRNAIRYFSPEMQASIMARATLKAELHHALERRQFQLYYQIQVDSSNRPVGAEVLIRWIHPERGLVPPAQFIPLAEQSGLILPIGQWVVETTCAQLKSWQQSALAHYLVLSLNVSARQYHQAEFAAQVRDAILRHDINPALLKLELTESMLIDDIDSTIDTMKSLSEIGIQFSLDDFGTGYSSLQYLKRLPIFQLKMDQSFVRDIVTDNSDKEIVRAIIAMAQSLNINVIAEGVETVEQRQFLLDNGCTNFQGYLFGKPVPIDQFEALLLKPDYRDSSPIS